MSQNVLRLDNITMQSDFINTAAGTTPYWSDKAIVSKQADTPNPWEGAWVVYPFANLGGRYARYRDHRRDEGP